MASPPPGGATDSVPPRYFLYVGGYHPRKGLEDLLPVWNELHRQGKLGVPIVLAGDKYYYSSSFKRLLREGTNSGAVLERGYVGDEELALLLRGATALIYPSRYEGFGLPPLEAMALGCPVITTRGTALVEVCGEAACYVDPADPAELGRAILRTYSDAALRVRLSEAGKRRASSFSWSRSAAVFLAGLEEACTREPKRPW